MTRPTPEAPAHFKTEQQLARELAVPWVHWFARHYTAKFHSIRAGSPCNLPAQGPAILISNHVSGVDPVILQAFCPRIVVWMMAREYYEVAALKWFFRRVEAIPVERSGRDMPAMRRALRALEDGRVVGVFPEGRITLDGSLQPFHTGVALLALRSGAVVCPASIEATLRNRSMGQAFTIPARGWVDFGSPLRLAPDVTGRDALDAVATQMRDAVGGLLARRNRLWRRRLS